jgi:hypothetical protein
VARSMSIRVWPTARAPRRPGAAHGGGAR